MEEAAEEPILSGKRLSRLPSSAGFKLLWLPDNETRCNIFRVLVKAGTKESQCNLSASKGKIRRGIVLWRRQTSW